MLVLTRRQGEYVLVYPSNIDSTMTVAELFRDGPIEVHVGSINKNQVRLNIKAPGELTILRNELVNEPIKQTATA